MPSCATVPTDPKLLVSSRRFKWGNIVVFEVTFKSGGRFTWGPPYVNAGHMFIMTGNGIAWDHAKPDDKQEFTGPLIFKSRPGQKMTAIAYDEGVKIYCLCDLNDPAQVKDTVGSDPDRPFPEPEDWI